MELAASLIVSLLSGILSGIVLYTFKKSSKEREEAEKQKHEQSIAENILILRSLNAVGKLTVENSLALRDGKTNNTLKIALEEYEGIQKELYNYLLNVNARK